MQKYRNVLKKYLRNKYLYLIRLDNIIYAYCYWEEYWKIKWLLNKLGWGWHKLYECHLSSQIKLGRDYELFVVFYNKEHNHNIKQKNTREKNNNILFRKNL